VPHHLLGLISSMVEFNVICYYMLSTHGIQVQSNRQHGFCFGFVEFEAPEAVQKAIEGKDLIRESGIPYIIVIPCALTEEPAGADLIFEQGDNITVKCVLPFSEQYIIDPKNPPPEKDYTSYFISLKDGIPGHGRFPAGRGSGFRNKGVRGCGNLGSGGRGFNRDGDFGIPRGEWESVRCCNISDRSRARRRAD
nr:hypothetical protein [Tanacetum cinerariifolium]